MLNEERLTVWTIGHSTRTSGEFLELIGAHGIEAVADVRRFPASRKYPHFNRDVMRDTLSEIAVEYAAMPELGGRRRPRRDSHNTAWRNESFRGYADYMETEEFQRGAERLLELARRKRTAVMCAEALWWRCHRSLIADYLKVQGVRVQHIVDRNTSELHPYTSAARVEHGTLSYSASE